ncbi:MAG: hypothetical protein JWN24_2891 [Phycisphaerales bacterium]|nr:hypothetical protein [Phycisphaerales bacterium]
MKLRGPFFWNRTFTPLVALYPNPLPGRERELSWIVAAFLALAASGCGYHMSGFGENDASFHNKTLYRDDVRTVAVPIFTNRTLYPGVEMPLTKAVINQLEAQSPYKVVPQERADTILEGEITGVRISTTSNNRVSAVPQEQIYSLIVKFTWRDLRNGQIYTQQTGFEQTAPYYPTLAEDRWVGEQQNIERMALAIVQDLQADWGTGKGK